MANSNVLAPEPDHCKVGVAVERLGPGLALVPGEMSFGVPGSAPVLTVKYNEELTALQPALL
jgi:hypothetical protein